MMLVTRLHERQRRRHRRQIWRQMRPGLRILIDGEPAMVVRPLNDTGFRRDQYVIQIMGTGQEQLISPHDEIEILTG